MLKIRVLLSMLMQIKYCLHGRMKVHCQQEKAECENNADKQNVYPQKQKKNKRK